MTIWHHDTLKAFSREVHKKDLTFDDMIDEINIEDEDFWVCRVNKVRYLFDSDKIKELPVRTRNYLDYPKDYEKVILNGKTYYKILNMQRVKIKAQKSMTPKELLNIFCDLSHSSSEQFKLYKILNLCGYFTRINCRIAGESEMGKNSVTIALKYLTGQARVINPASYPALLRGLETTKLLNITEPSDFDGFSKFLEDAGDRHPDFENPKLASGQAHTKNNYNINQLSCLITYNTLDYYKERNQEDKFFDNMFRHHILTRFMPFKFDGKIKDVEKSEYNTQIHDSLLTFLRNLNYYHDNWQNHLHGYKLTFNNIKWGIRWRDTFTEIARFCDFISESEAEYDNLINQFMNTHRAYLRMMLGNSTTIKEYNEQPKVERIKEEPLKVTEEFIDDSPQTASQGGYSEITNSVVSPLSPLDFIRNEDTGNGVSTDRIAKGLDSSVGEIYPMLIKLGSNGDIFEHKPDRWKVLE